MSPECNVIPPLIDELASMLQNYLLKKQEQPLKRNYVVPFTHLPKGFA